MLRFRPPGAAAWGAVRSVVKQQTASRVLASEILERFAYLFFITIPRLMPHTVTLS